MAIPATAPILLAPLLKELENVDLDPFEDALIESIAWNNISIDIPEFPETIVGLAPEMDSATEPVAPVVSLSDFPNQELTNLELETPCISMTDIGLPPSITLSDWTDLIPQFTAAIPTGEVIWEWEELAYALSTVLADKYDLLILPSEYLSRGLYRNKKIWENLNDELIQRGQSNSYKARKDADALRNVNEFNSWVLIEGHKNDVAFDKMYISNRQEYQKILRRYHDFKQKLNFSFVTSVLKNGVRNYNACIQAMNAQIASYREEAAVYLGDIQRRGLLIENVKGRLAISTKLNAANRAEVAYLATQVNIQKGVIQYFKSQMELSKATLQVELLQLQLDRLEIDNFAALNQALIKVTMQEIAEKEADLEKARLSLKESIRERLEAELTAALADLEAAKIVFEAEREAFTAIQEAKKEEYNNFDNEVTARQGIIQQQIFGDEARAFLARERSKEELTSLLRRQERLDHEYEKDLIQAKDVAGVRFLQAKEEGRIEAAQTEATAARKIIELAAQNIIAQSSFRQTLTHQISQG